MKFFEIKKYIYLVVCLGIAGCSGNSEKKLDIVQPNQARDLYYKGIQAINKNSYDVAVKHFADIDKEYPADKIVINASIQKIYSYFESQQYDELTEATDNFIAQYPWHKEIAYVYYMKAMAYYSQILDSGRDQTMSFKALKALNDVIYRFKNSKFAKDARFKKDFVINTIANKEMEIGYYYLKSNKLLAALNRFNTVVNKYDTTIFIPEALYRMIEINIAMGIREEANKYKAILGHNHPHSKWYLKAYKL